MPTKPDITNASDALWSAAVERERVISPRWRPRNQVSRSEVEGAAQELELSRAMVYRLVARYRRVCLLISCEIYSLSENDSRRGSFLSDGATCFGCYAK
jgi:hypothetical protein